MGTLPWKTELIISPSLGFYIEINYGYNYNSMYFLGYYSMIAPKKTLNSTADFHIIVINILQKYSRVLSNYPRILSWFLDIHISLF